MYNSLTEMFQSKNILFSKKGFDEHIIENYVHFNYYNKYNRFIYKVSKVQKKEPRIAVRREPNVIYDAISNFVQENCREEQVPYEEVEEYIETIPYTEEECHAENLIYSKIDSSWDYANCLDDDTICYEEGFLGRWPIIEECME